MKSISNRITLPLVLNAVLIPIIVLLVFNGVMRLYMLSNARQDLKETAIVTQSLIRQQINLQDKIDSESSTANLTGIRALLQTTSRFSQTDLLVINQNRQIIFPADAQDLNLDQPVLVRLKQRIGRGLVSGNIQSITSTTGQVLYLAYPLYGNAPEQSPWVVYMMRFSPTKGILLVTNLILLTILLVGSLISILLSRHTAKRIRRSLQQFSQFADQVGQGAFSSAQPDPFCKEISDLQLQFNQMAERLSQADQLQKTFLQNASHELRTPLQAIQGYAEGLEKGVLPDVPGAAAIIRSESLRLNHLVDSLLILGRIDSQSNLSDMKELDPADWLRDQVQRFKGVAAAQGKTICIHLDAPESGSVIRTDENLLGQIFSNLMTNAIRYTDHAIWISLSYSQASISLSVRDDGPGIAEDDLQHLFDRFYKGKNGHFGLGLAIARSAVAVLKGTMAAANHPDGGAILTINLPLLPDR